MESSGMDSSLPAYRVYVRGHGGRVDGMLPPSEELPISVITLGQFGSTMSDQVAEQFIGEHVDVADIESEVEDRNVIYWTKLQRDVWHSHRILQFTKPTLTITSCDTIEQNLSLNQSRAIGDCGVCYWDESRRKLEWIVRLKQRQSILLTQILQKLKAMAREENTVELYWTACMSAEKWHGTNMKVSLNPSK